MKRCALSALLLTVLVTSAAQADSARLRQVIDHMVAAYGGEEKLAKLERTVQAWDFYAPTRRSHGRDLRTVRLPHRLRVELVYPDRRETRILDGEAAYASHDEQPAAPVQGPRADAMRLQLMRLYSPLVLRERSADLDLTEEGGLMALSLVEGGLRVDYLVNPETWRIEKVVGNLDMNGMPMRFLTEYSDFAFVEGVLVHRKETKYAGAVKTADLNLSQIEFPAELDERWFEP